MTNPYEPGWADLPGLSSEAPGATPVPPKRAWYRAPGSLIGAATYSALMAWVGVGGILLVRGFLASMAEGGALFEALGVLLLLAFAPVLLVVAFLFVAGVVATVPLAVVWVRDPRRSTAAGLALAHAVLAWAALAVALVLVAA